MCVYIYMYICVLGAGHGGRIAELVVLVVAVAMRLLFFIVTSRLQMTAFNMVVLLLLVLVMLMLLVISCCGGHRRHRLLPSSSWPCSSDCRGCEWLRCSSSCVVRLTRLLDHLRTGCRHFIATLRLMLRA